MTESEKKSLIAIAVKYSMACERIKEVKSVIKRSQRENFNIKHGIFKALDSYELHENFSMVPFGVLRMLKRKYFNRYVKNQRPNDAIKNIKKYVSE